MQEFASQMHIRVTFLSGDVHCAAVGVLKTLVKDKKIKQIDPSQDHRYMLNVVTSAYQLHGALPIRVLTSSLCLFCSRSLPGAIVNTP